MRRIPGLIFSSILLLAIAAAFPATADDADSGTWYGLTGPLPATAELVAVQPLDDGVELTLRVPGFHVNTVATPQGPRGTLDLPGGGLTSIVGSPRLPVLRYLIEAPPGAKLHLELTASSSRRLMLRDLGLEARLLPVQLPVPKLEGAASTIAFVEDEAVYAADGLYPAEAVAEIDRAVIRGRHVAQVEVRPFRHNPARGTIEVWTEARLTVRFEGGLPEAASRAKSRLASAQFDAWLDEVIVSAPGAGSATASKGPGGGAATGAAGMLVICHDDFLGAIAPFIDWKEKTGFKVEVVPISSIGPSPSDADLKAVIQAAYDTWSAPPLEFVLMVGDTDFTPIHTGNGGGNSQVTDNWYACLDGTDYLPEVAISRISTRTAQETTDVVDKLLTYERALFGTDTWIKMAGYIGTADSGHITQIEDTHDYCIDNFYTPNDYLPTAWSHGAASCDRHYNTTSATTAQISASIDEGRSMINYSGHGSTTGWEGPTSSGSYGQSNVRANVNAGMYPFVISNACITGSLALTECFAETWQKVPNAGAIGFWGASNNSYWDEDDVLQRALHANIFPMDDTPPLGVIVNETKLDLYNHYGATGNVAYYYDMYNLLSEPSLSMWTRAPRALTVSYPAAHPIGESTFAVTVTHDGQPVEGALVGVRKGDEGVLEGAYTDALGQVTLTLDPAPESVGDLELTVTGHDWMPYEATATVIAPDMPWLIHRSHGVDDSAGGDGDGHPNPGEEFVMPVTVENVGEQPGTGLAGTLTTSTPAWCEILDGYAAFPDLAAHVQGTSLPDHYAVRVLPGAPDGALLGFNLAWSAGDGSSGTTSFQEQVQAVDLAVDHFSIDDTAGGNGNGVAGPGETVDLVVTLANVGHRPASGISGTLTSASPYVTILQGTAGYPNLAGGAAGDSAPAYQVEIAEGAPDSQPVTLDLALTETGSGHVEVIQLDLMVSSCATTWSADVPHTISDNTTFESTLDYLSAITLNEVNVYVDISHSYQGDLTVTLESPQGTQVVLHNRSGGSADDIVTWYDEETAPAEPLSVLAGESAFGTWKLIVNDGAGGDTGTLNAWALEFCGDPILPVARLAMGGWSMSDLGQCDPDGVGDVGETVLYEVTVSNAGWGASSGGTALLHSSSPVAVLNNPVALPDLPVGAETVVQFEVLIGAVECMEVAEFTLEMNCSDGRWFDTFSDKLEWDDVTIVELEDVEHGGAVPAGWSHASGSGFDNWAVVNTQNHTVGGSWAWFTAVSNSIRDSWLISPPYTIAGTPSAIATFSFWHYRNLDSGSDGAVLELSDNGGASWSDAGTYITEGGYNDSITGNVTHPLNNRSVWSGAFGWQRVAVNMTSRIGDTVIFRWRVASGFFGQGTGWWIDDFEMRVFDEPCDTHACGIPGEVRLTGGSKAGAEAVLEWWEDPLCMSFRAWRSTDATFFGAFADVTGEDADPTDCEFRDASPGTLQFFLIQGTGPDGEGPLGHYGQ